MRRFMNALTVLIYGLGALVLIMGIVTRSYSWKIGIIGAVILWIIGVTLRVYVFSIDEDEEFGNYEPRELWFPSETASRQTAGRRTKEAQTPEVQDQVVNRYVWDATKLAWVKDIKD